MSNSDMNETIRIKLKNGTGHIPVVLGENGLSIIYGDGYGGKTTKTIFYNTISEIQLYEKDAKQNPSVVISLMAAGIVAFSLFRYGSNIISGILAACPFYIPLILLMTGVISNKSVTLHINNSGTPFDIIAKGSEKEKLEYIKDTVESHNRALHNSIVTDMFSHL